MDVTVENDHASPVAVVRCASAVRRAQLSVDVWARPRRMRMALQSRVSRCQAVFEVADLKNEAGCLDGEQGLVVAAADRQRERRAGVAVAELGGIRAAAAS